MEVPSFRVSDKVYLEIREFRVPEKKPTFKGTDFQRIDIPKFIKGFWVLRTTKLDSVFTMWKKQRTDGDNDIVFLFEGQPLDPSATVCESPLQSCDIIDVISDIHSIRLGKVEEKFGYRFKNKHLGIIALSDFLPMRKLAQIGDRVLDVAVYLFMKRTPSYGKQQCKTTDLVKRALVSNVPLRDVFTNWGLDKFIVFNIRERDTKLYPDMVEALLGAIYLDSGHRIEAVQRAIARLRIGVFARDFVDPKKAKSIDGEEKEEAGTYARDNLQDFLEMKRELQTHQNKQFFHEVVDVMESYRKITDEQSF